MGSSRKTSSIARGVLCWCALWFSGPSPLLAQGSLHLDPAYVPALLPQTTYVREVMPLPDGRAALVEFWEESNLFYNQLGCLEETGERDASYDTLRGMLGLFPWNEGAFYSWRAYYQNHVQRHHVENGAIDEGFRIASTAWPGAYEINYVQDVSVDSEGRVYVVGWIDLVDTLNGLVGSRDIVRLDHTGALDLTFTPADSENTFKAFPLPDGRVLISGFQTMYNGVPVPRMFAILEDGSLDPSFSTGFIKALATSVLPLPDGGVIATGSFINFVSLIQLDTMNVVRLLPDGTQDPTFNHHLRPHQEYASGSYTSVESILSWGPDHYLISGNFDQVDGHPKRGIAMIDRDGTLMLDECEWSGPGPVEQRVAVQLVSDGADGAYAFGSFDGFDDGQASVESKGLVRLIGRPVGVPAQIDGPERAPRLFPMPAGDRVRVQLPDAMKGQGIGIKILDAAGLTVLDRPTTRSNGELGLDLSSIASGSYILQIITDTGGIISQHLNVAR